MERKLFDTTQNYVSALVEANKEMEENQKEIAPVIEGLMTELNRLKEENETMRMLQEKRDKKEEMRKRIEKIESENLKMKEENMRKDRIIEEMKGEMYLKEEMSKNTIEELKHKIKEKDEELVMIRKDNENVLNEIEMYHKQMEMMIKQMEIIDRKSEEEKSEIMEVESSMIRSPEKKKRKLEGIVVFVSGVSKESKKRIKEEIEKRGAILQEVYDNNVTHVVVSNKITLMTVKGLLDGKWVVNKMWVMNGMRNNEQRYGCRNENLFDGKKFYATEEFLKDKNSKQIWDLVTNSCRVEIVNSFDSADISLIGNNEKEEGKNIFSKDSFIRTLPLPQTTKRDILGMRRMISVNVM